MKRTIKLTAERLEELVREVIKEQNTPFKSDLERKNHLQKQSEEAKQRRDKRDRVLPGYSELLSLSKGVLTEEELLAAPDTEEFVKIKATALHRLLDGREVLNEDAKTKCNAAGYYHIDDILSFITRLKQAEKGKAN
jgi:hypothetical protein